MPDEPQYTERERALIAKSRELGVLEQKFRSAYPQYADVSSEDLYGAADAVLARDPGLWGPGADPQAAHLNEGAFLAQTAEEVSKGGHATMGEQLSRDQRENSAYDAKGERTRFTDPRGRTVSLW